MENLRLKPEGPTPEEIAARREGNFGFTTVKRYDEGIGHLKLDGFQDPAYVGETAVRAMQEFAGSRAVTIDLRENHGGEGKIVRLLASYFLPAKTRLTSLYFRFEDRTQETWTHDEVDGQSPDAGLLVALMPMESRNRNLHKSPFHHQNHPLIRSCACSLERFP